jgi:hypothetical protein
MVFPIRLYLQWLLANAVAYALAAVLAVIMVQEVGWIGIVLALIVWIGLIALAQWLVLRGYLHALNGIRWVSWTLVAFVAGLAIDIAVGAILVLCRFGMAVGAGPRDYMPYAETQLLILIAALYVLGSWGLVWYLVARAQWRVLQPCLQNTHGRTVWLVNNIGASTLVVILAYMIVGMTTRRTEATSGPADFASHTDLYYLLLGLTLGIFAGAITGVGLVWQMRRP